MTRKIRRSASSSSNRRETDDSGTTVEKALLSKKWNWLVYLGSDTREPIEISRGEVVSSLWEGRLDTPCLICGDSFEDQRGPPIRTFSIEKRSEDVGHYSHSWSFDRMPCFRIRNRHAGCLKDQNIRYLPVSHVWHPAIAEAHESRRSTHDAEKILLEVVGRTAYAATKEFGDGCEIWHDYIRIPQWNYHRQQALLLLLPTIFSLGDITIVHLSDVSVHALMGFDVGTEQENFLTMVQFRRSEWFQRMWVTLEYAHSKHVRILANEWRIIPYRGPTTPSTLPRDAVLFTLMECQKFQGSLSQGDVATWEKEFQRPNEVYPYVLVSKPDSHCFTLGEAINFTADRACRVYRDRFIAINGFLGLKDHADIVAKIPRDDREACKYIWRKCLERGDYTPLLLNPCGEEPVEGASWLIGHERMVPETWAGCGISSPALNPTIIRNGKIAIEMEFVGCVEKDDWIWFADSQPEGNFDTLLVKFAQTHGGEKDLSESFVATLGRLYPVPTVFNVNMLPIRFSEYVEAVPDFRARLEQMLRGFCSFPTRSATEPNRQTGRGQPPEPTRSFLDRAAEIRTFLKLSEPLSNSGFTRLDVPPQRDRTAGFGPVRCGECLETFIYRLELYQDPRFFMNGARLFRIPGLGYHTTHINGVGLVVCEKRIVGKMFYGTPACHCKNKMELVDIE